MCATVFPEVPTGAVTSEPPRGRGAARLAVLGDPIAHSKSPQLQLAAYRKLGVDWEYWRWQIPAGGLRERLENRGQGWRGVSVTAPLKAEALAFAQTADPLAELTGAANTLVFETLDPAAPAHAANTDVAGIVAAFGGLGLAGGHVDVLGAGGTAVSAVAAAAQMGAQQVRVFARRPDAAAELAAELGPKFAGVQLRAADLASWQPDDAAAVIDTIPGGCPVRPDLQGTDAPLLSAAYDPWPTELAKVWAGRVIPGTEMLLQQAVVQVRLFSGRAIDEPLPNESAIVQEMRVALNNSAS